VYKTIRSQSGRRVGLGSRSSDLHLRSSLIRGSNTESTVSKAATCPFRDSTKYRDPYLEVTYYDDRWYGATAMKWLTPGPLGERAGA